MMRVGTAYYNTLGEVERLLTVIDGLAWQENGISW
jgi:selenocysteine lyase/cysteine desulfurase